MIKRIVLLFFIWRLALFFVAVLAGFIIPNFGDRFPYSESSLAITKLPNWIWGFGNFDGVHFLRIAQNGYTSAGSQAFFPLYPILTNLLSQIHIFPYNPSLDRVFFVDPSFFYSAFFISNLFALLTLIIFFLLARIDVNERKTYLSMVILLAFPTAFYLGSLYSESLFFFLSLFSLYLMRKRKFLLSGIFIALSSLTRLVGIFLILSLLIEIYPELKKSNIQKKTKLYLSVLISGLGLIFYMIFLQSKFYDFLSFYSVQPSFGAERSGGKLILLPHVMFRYLKIFSSTPFASLGFFNAALEFIATFLSLGLVFIFWRKIRLSYLAFIIPALVLPTLTGTLSSMPRYVLVTLSAVPILTNLKKKYLYLMITVFALLEAVLLTLFIRGYWVA